MKYQMRQQLKKKTDISDLTLQDLDQSDDEFEQFEQDDLVRRQIKKGMHHHQINGKVFNFDEELRKCIKMLKFTRDNHQLI